MELSFQGDVVLQPSRWRVGLQTRLRSDIDNEHDASPPIDGMIIEARDYRRRFPSIFRTVGPTLTYNCHGMTFGSRRTQIDDSAEVRKIIAEDGYVSVPEVSQVLPGDVVLYIAANGDIEHSGVVVQNDDLGLVRNPLVLSKWGSADEAIHRLAACPYDATRVRYFRITS